MILSNNRKTRCIFYFVVIAVVITFFGYSMNNIIEQPFRSPSTGTGGSKGAEYDTAGQSETGGSKSVDYNTTGKSETGGSKGAEYDTAGQSETGGSKSVDYNTTGKSETGGSKGAEYNTAGQSETGGSKSVDYNTAGKSETGGSKSTDYNMVGKLQERRRLPQCLIIGVKKAGTLALLKFLSIHPDIVIPDSNEIHFFDNDGLYKKGLNYYKSQMPLSKPHQITIEKTPSYFHTWTVPERVHKMNSSVKLLLMVREPVERIISEYDMMSDLKDRTGVVYASFRSLVLTKQNTVNNNYLAVNISTYWAHFSRWLQYFPRKQIHLINGKSFATNPHKELYAIEKFLGIKHFISDKNLVFVKSKRFFCPVTNGNKPKCLPKSKGRKHPDRNPKILNKLKQYFQPLNEKFFDLSSTRFDWS